MNRFPQLEDAEWLLGRYREGLTTTAIARLVGCQRQTVTRWRKRHEIAFTPLAAGEQPAAVEPILGEPTIGQWVTAGGPLRQSLVRTFDQCPQAAIWSTERNPDHHSGPSSLGSAFHMVAAEILNTMRRTGEVQIPSQEAVEVMYETVGRPTCPHLSDEQMATLRILVLQFAGMRWQSQRIISLEQRFRVEIPCPDGQVRVLTGSPDVLLADPPHGAVLVDYKTGWAVPPVPRDGNWDRDAGRPYLSERGTFQLDSYGLMAMREFPTIDYCKLREAHVRLGEFREATLRRDELEHVERRLGVLLMRLDRALETREAEPRAGSWCSHCPRPSRCPIEPEERGEGAVTSMEEAQDLGAQWAVAKSRYEQGRAPLKAFHEETGEPIRVGDAWIGWRYDEKGKRAFGIHNRPSYEDTRVAVAA